MNWIKSIIATLRAAVSGRNYGRLQFDEQFFPAAGSFRFLSPKSSPLWRAMVFGVWLYPFTQGGKVLIAGFSIAFLIGAVSVDVPMYQIFVALLALIVVTSTIGSMFRTGKVEITGSFPDQTSAGQMIRGEFRVVNCGRIPLYDLGAACFLPPTGWEVHPEAMMIPYLGCGQSGVLPVALTPQLRGLYTLPPVRVFTTFPFNLNRNQIGKTRSSQILVLPRFHPLTTVRLDIGNRYQPGGISLTSNIGESPEYIGNREYQPGDSPRRIDFRSWARLFTPVVREYQEEYYCRIALVLDTFVPQRRFSTQDTSPALEAAVSVSASIAEALARGEFIIDLFAAGPELHVFRAGRHTAHLENVLEILASVGCCHTNPFEKLGPALINELAQISTVVCVLLDWDLPRQQLVRSAQEAGCHVKVIVVREGPTTIPIGQAEHVDIAAYAPDVINAGRIEEL